MIPGKNRPNLGKPFVAARTAIENDLTKIWENILEIDEIGIHDNFFEMGGDSLQVAMLIAAMRENYKVQMSLRTVFERPTIAELVSIIDGSRNEGADSSEGRENEDLKDKLKKLESDL